MNTQLPTTPTPSNPTQDNEIDLLDLAKILWNGRFTLLKVTLLAGALGIIIALLSPVEYASTTSMVPQTAQSANKLGGLSSLAAMAGFNLDMASQASEALSPMVYPQILQSGPFQLELMNTPFSFSEVDHPVSLYEYYTEIQQPGVLSVIGKYTIGLPGIIITAIKGNKDKTINSGENGLIAFSEKQDMVAKIMKEKVILTIDAKQGYLTLQASFHEALLSAQVADQSRELLQKYITQFKIEKAANKLAFIEERYEEKKKDFEKAQQRLARYRDQNRNMSSAVARTEEERLQGEFNIAMNICNELAKQLEQAKIQVKEETPVFSVLEPAVIPYEKTKPKKVMIIFIWLFLGGIVSVGIIFGKAYLSGIKQKWNENNLPEMG
ncbi:MAG TPA: Wzz/FepE/Etk N-terminal domain-containing protein [Prolixibacteraceae bacterium]|nr:Wzz/FepE/Etk N-terminal domain-containing protein [Prolixibacteraceae bacterium]